MSNRLPVQPSRTSVSRRRIAKLYSSTSNDPNGNTKSSANRPIPLKIKKESSDDEIKEYAASAMSEFLGLYGYEKVDSGCTRGLNLDHFVSSASGKQHSSRTLTRSLASKAVAAASSSPISTNPSGSPHSRSSRSPPTNISVISVKENSGPPTSSSLSLQTGLASPRAHENSDSASDSPDGATMCSWCGRAEGTWEPGGAYVTYGRASGSGQFCSESCFAAGRRAAFKRARTCDWCRHVRPSMSYTDFQDGDNQLQFCSQKCLNQYKMNIFCRETQAHLALHGINNTISSTNLGTSNLITPELWYRDCISPSSRSEELIVDDDPVTRSSSTHDDDESLNKEEDDEEEEEENKRETNNRCRNSFRTRDNASRKNIEDHDVRIDEDESFTRIRKNSEKEDESRRQNKQFMEQIRLQFPTENLSKFGTSISPIIRDRSKDYTNSAIQDSGSSHESEGIARETFIMKETVESIPKENSRGRRNIRYGMTKPKKSSKSPTCTSEHSTPPLSLMTNSTPRMTHPPNTPFKFPTHPGMLSGRPLLVRPPMIPLRPQIPLNTPLSSTSSSSSPSSSSLLPPVTVLVPYPIPIPIPIPIPLPIPLFSKLLKGNSDFSLKDEKVSSGASIPEDLSKRKVSTPETKVSNEISEITKPPSPSTSDLKTTQIYSNEIVDEKIKPVCLATKNSRPSRKRRRNPENPEEIDIQLKRKMSV